MLAQPRVVARDYRNRRVGDFLRELHLTEGRATGLPKIRRAMQANGSPAPVFEMDEAHTYFLTILPVHSYFVRRPLTAREAQILRFCQQPRSRKEILAHLGLSSSLANSTRYITPLLSDGYLAFTIPEVPQHVRQRYLITPKGQQALA